MFTVQELVDQGYTVKHARQFTSREAVNHRNGKMSLKARRETVPVDRGGAVRPTLREQMEAVQAKSTGRTPGSRRSEHERLAQIREWARTKGHNVSTYSKIPDSIVQEYVHAHDQEK